MPSIKNKKRKPHNKKSNLSSKANSFAPRENDLLISWNARDFIKYEKGIIWWIYFCLTIAALIVWNFNTFKDWYSAVVLVIVAIAYFIFCFLEPKIIPIAISKRGIQFNKRFIQFSDIKQSWTIYVPGEVNVLRIEVKEKWHPEIIDIQLEAVSRKKIAEILSAYTPEVANRKEDTFEWLKRIFRF